MTRTRSVKAGTVLCGPTALDKAAGKARAGPRAVPTVSPAHQVLFARARPQSDHGPLDLLANRYRQAQLVREILRVDARPEWPDSWTLPFPKPRTRQWQSCGGSSSA